MGPDRAFPIRTGNSSFQSNVASGHARVHMGDVYNVTHSGAAPASLREQILDSLWFDMMEARQDNIKGATPNTLDWIYDSDFEDSDSQISDSEEKDDQDPDSKDHEQLDPADEDRDAQDPYNGDQDSQDSSSETQDEQDSDDDQAEQWQHSESRRRRDWDSLAKWLREDDSIYWVCGKAASGKSTLMAHIVDDERTRDCLSMWAKGKPLHILKFFFWRPGTELQKSTTGLLRALLFQICDEVKDAMSHVVKASHWNSRRQKPWSDKHLVSAIEAVLTSSREVFCFFLDGLDEFVGDLNAIMELIHRLEDLENVKLCVSSRPEAELTANFSCCKQLRLERLNHADIEKFVMSQLDSLRHKPVFNTSKYETYIDFINEVVYRADGVFLWAVLVVRTLAKGIALGDNWNMLHTRLTLTPTAINDLYASMLATLDPLHREFLYFYLELTRFPGRDCWTKAAISQITAARIGEDLLNMSYEAFLTACEQERLQIIGCSVGLLQISEASRGHKIVQCVAIPQLTAHGGTSPARFHSAKDAAKLRKPMNRSVLNAGAHFRADNEYIEWIHRSAHDFIFPPDGSVSPVCDSHFGRADVWKKFLLGNLNALAVLPSFSKHYEQQLQHVSTSMERLFDLIRIADDITNTETAIGLKIAEEMRLVVCNMHKKDYDWSDLPYAQISMEGRVINIHNKDYGWSDLPYAPEERGASLKAYPLWLSCSLGRAQSVAQALLSVLLSEPAGNALFMPLWHKMALPPSGFDRGIMPFLTNIEQNFRVPGEASAQIVLYFEGKRNATGCTYQRVRHLSCTVPDFPGPIKPAAMQWFFRKWLLRHYLDPWMLIVYFDRVAISTCMFSDIDIKRPKTIDGIQAHRYRVLLQCSYQLKKYLCPSVEDPDRDPDDCDGFRVVCLPAGYWICGDRDTGSLDSDKVEYGEKTEFIHFAPSRRTCVCLAQGLLQAQSHAFGHRDLSDETMLRQWAQMLVDDIRENSQGLDATQQLFAFACVKWTVPRWLGCTMQIWW